MTNSSCFSTLSFAALCALFLIGLFLAPQLGARELAARGVIYHDINANGQRDNNEPGLPGVLVSNGEQIVASDLHGAYELAIDALDGMVFVLKPRNYRLPVDANQLPRFWYWHRPDGATVHDDPAIQPTGPLPGRINFGLIRQAEADEFQVLVMADPQIKNLRDADFYRRDIINDLMADSDGVVFGWTLGDLVHDNLDLMPVLNRLNARVGIPWFNVLGNHDLNFDAVEDRGSADTFRSIYGPTTYAFQVGRVHFIYFDNVIHWRDKEGDKHYVGGLRDDQLAFIEAYLSHVPVNHRIVLGMHIPLYNPGKPEEFRDQDRRRLLSLLSQYPYTLSLSGHSHNQRHVYLGASEGWSGRGEHHHYTVGAACGSFWSGALDARGLPDATMSDGTPNGYAKIHFNSDNESQGYSVDYISAGLSDDEWMRIYGPGAIIQNSYPNAYFYVNVFNASRRDTVLYRVDDGEWFAMLHVAEKDPFVLEQNFADMVSNHPLDNDRLSPASISTHLWKARVDTGVDLGWHDLEVKVIDQYGRVFLSQTRFLSSEAITSN